MVNETIEVLQLGTQYACLHSVSKSMKIYFICAASIVFIHRINDSLLISTARVSLEIKNEIKNDKLDLFYT